MNADSANSFWNRRRVLITGHTGFVGSWMSLFLVNLGAAVTGFSLPPPSKPSLFEVISLAKCVSTIAGDVRDKDSLSESMSLAAPEVVFHLAAQPLVLQSYKEPVETYATNIMGLVHLLEAVRSVESIKAVVVITSDKCYENFGHARGYREDDPMGGHDPYSSSKGCAELVASAYRRSFLEKEGKAVATARAGNIIGGGDWGAYRLVPDLVRSFSKGETLLIRHPDAIRPWQHVLDPIRGYLALAERLIEGEMDLAQGWNFGPDEKDIVTVRQLVKLAADIWGTEAQWTVFGSDCLHEAKVLKLDCRKAKIGLDWYPRLDLKTSLQWTIEWYRSFYRDKDDMLALCLDQIREFQTKANMPSNSA